MFVMSPMQIIFYFLLVQNHAHSTLIALALFLRQPMRNKAHKAKQYFIKAA